MGNAQDAWSYGLFIPHDPRAVGVARATLRSVLKAARLDCIVDTAELLLSELVTNAYRHSSTDAYVSMDRSPEDFRVTVWDTGPGLPAVRSPRADEECGRGLGLVQAWADSWGVQDCTDPTAGVTGKAVWFSMAPKRD